MKKIKRQKGVTLMELMIVVAIAAVVTLSVGIVLADSLKGWNTLYGSIHSDEAENTYATRLLFDKAVRKSSSNPLYISVSPTLMTIAYYSDLSLNTSVPDREARFRYTGTELIVEDRNKSTGAVLSSWPIKNVSACTFRQSGRAIEMTLTLSNTLNNRPKKYDVFMSAYLYNP